MLLLISQNNNTTCFPVRVPVFVFYGKNAHRWYGTSTFVTYCFEFVLGNDIVDVHIVDAAVVYSSRYDECQATLSEFVGLRARTSADGQSSWRWTAETCFEYMTGGGYHPGVMIFWWIMDVNVNGRLGRGKSCRMDPSLLFVTICH